MALFTGQSCRPLGISTTDNFAGLMALIRPNRLAMACVFSALFGIGTAVTTVIPITALALSVPSFLLGTAGTISISMRALGGIIGITIFTAIFDNKLAVHLPVEVTQVVLAAGYKPSLLKEVFQILSVPDPSFLYKSPLPKKLIGIVAGAVVQARQGSWTFVWVAIACIVAANAFASCFLHCVAERMNQHIESALEQSEVRQEQMHGW